MTKLSVNINKIATLRNSRGGNVPNLLTRYSTWKGPTLHLEDLIVTEEMKGKGIGSMLYSAFLEYADKAGVERVEWTWIIPNRPSSSLCSE